MRCQAGFVTHMFFTHASPCRESEIDTSTVNIPPNFPQKQQVVCGPHVGFSPPHLFLCHVPTCNGCCRARPAIKQFPGEATWSGREWDHSSSLWKAVRIYLHGSSSASDPWSPFHGTNMIPFLSVKLISAPSGPRPGC